MSIIGSLEVKEGSRDELLVSLKPRNGKVQSKRGSLAKSIQVSSSRQLKAQTKRAAKDEPKVVNLNLGDNHNEITYGESKRFLDEVRSELADIQLMQQKLDAAGDLDEEFMTAEEREELAQQK